MKLDGEMVKDPTVRPTLVTLVSLDTLDGALSREVLIASPEPKIPNFYGSINIFAYNSEKCSSN